MSTAEKTTSQILNAERERILCLSYKDGGESKETFKLSSNEVVDIVNDYPWILDKVQGEGKKVRISSILAGIEENKADSLGGGYIKKTKVPVCYMVERKNAVSGSITTLLGMLGALDQIANGLKEVGSTIKNVTANSGTVSSMLGGAVGGAASLGGDAVLAFKDFVSNIIKDGFTRLNDLSTFNNLNDEIFNPYRFMYFTEDTKKRYVFPLTSDAAASFLPTKLSWENSKIIDNKSKIGKFVHGILDTLTSGAQLSNMINNVTRLTDGNSTADDMGHVQESAKSFKYPSSGDQLKINFTLYNTTRKNAWKNNYRFLLLFAIRNAPFRLELFSFVPPLIYDITIPGIKRMPISVLSNMKVTPVGTLRVLNRDNFIASKFDDENMNANIQVTVPEAWQIELTFQSLIAPSANLILAPLLGKLGISPSAEIGKPKQQLSAFERETIAERVANTDANEMKKKCDTVITSEWLDRAFTQLDMLKRLGATDELLRLFRDTAIWMQRLGDVKDIDRDKDNKWSPSEGRWEELPNLPKTLLTILSTFGIAPVRANDGSLGNWEEDKREVLKANWHNVIEALQLRGYVIRLSFCHFEWGLAPALLSSQAATTFGEICVANGIDGYTSSSEAETRLVKEGAQTLLPDAEIQTKVNAGIASTDIIVHLYGTYVKENGQRVSWSDVEAFRDSSNNLSYYVATQVQAIKTTKPADKYYDKEKRAEVLREINQYNQNIAHLEKDQDGDKPKSTPICEDLIKAQQTKESSS